MSTNTRSLPTPRLTTGWVAERKRLHSRQRQMSERSSQALSTAAEKGLIRRMWCNEYGLVTEAVRLPDGRQSDCLLCVAKWDYYGLG